jgi:carboxyl-terminal processing protease
MEMEKSRPNGAHTAGPGTWRLAVSLLVGAALGWLGAMGCAAPKPGPDYQLMAQAWSTMQRHYVERGSVNPTEMTYGAISGMVDALGDSGHSTFLTPTMVKELKETEQGEFKGIGVEIRLKDDRVVIVSPIDDSPAERAGLRAGDIITRVSDQDITGWPLSRVVEHIAGRPGTTIKLTIQDPRTERTRLVTVARTTIKVHDISWQELPGTGIAHLRIASFDEGATRDLRKVLRAIQAAHIKGIILDLRNNPGGILDEAIGVASQFLRQGNVLLVRDGKGRTSPVPVEKGGLATDIPLVALINGGSASAAEIVAGALKDGRRGQLVGESTFGTGTVLREFQLSDGSALLLAIEEWLTPDGHSFWHKGIQPQVVVSQPDLASLLLPRAERQMTPAQLHTSSDRQLLRALDLVSQPARGEPGREVGRDVEALKR